MRKLISARQDGELPVQACHLLRAHLDDCDNCRSFTEQIRAIAALIAATAAPL